MGAGGEITSRLEWLLLYTAYYLLVLATIRNTSEPQVERWEFRKCHGQCGLAERQNRRLHLQEERKANYEH